MFKKRSTKSALRRKRVVDEGEDGAEEKDGGDAQSGDSEEDGSLTLEEAKLLQKDRFRKKGLLVTREDITGGLSRKRQKKNVEEEDKEDETAGYGLQERRKTDLLDGNFTMEVTVDKIDKKMEEYINEQMAIRGFTQSDAPKEKKNRLEEIYDLPDFLKLRARPADESLDNFLTGIVEIDLPIEEKMRVAQETEIAKRRMQGGGGKYGGKHDSKQKQGLAELYALPKEVQPTSNHRRFDLPHERIYSDFEDPHAQDGAAPVPVATGSVPGRGAPHEPQREGRFRTEVFASTDAPQSNPVRRSLPTRETLKRAQEEAEAESYRRLRQSMGLEASAPPKDASASSEGGRPFRRNPHMASDDFAVERFKRMMRNRLR